MGKAPVTAVLLTLNEESNLGALLDHILPWVQQVFIVDSLSTDRTVDIALERGAQVVQRPFTDFGDQWNWALEHLPIDTPWTMKLDPDERFTPQLRDEIQRELAKDPACNSYAFRRRLWFMGQPMRQFQWVLRIWRTGHCHFSDVLVNEHPIVEGAVCQLQHFLEHLDSPTLYHWFEKQNHYSTMRAIELAQGSGYATEPRFRGNQLQRRMFYKKLFFKLPFRHVLMWWYLALGRGALLDGHVGRAWVFMRVNVYRWAELKAQEMRQVGKIPAPPQRSRGEFDPRVVDSKLQRSVTLDRTNKATSQVHPAKRTKTRLRVAVNAVSLAPGGGLVVLLGYLHGWREMGHPFELDIYASRPVVMNLLRNHFPETRVLPFAAEMDSVRHFTLQQLTLGRRIDEAGSDVVLATNSLVVRCKTAQVVLQQNRKRFMTGFTLKQLRTGGLGEAVKDLAARQALRHSISNAFISGYLLEQAQRIVPESRMRNHVVYNALTSEQIKRSNTPNHETINNAQIVAIQSPAEHKDNPTLFRMLARLIEMRPDAPWRLKLASDGDWSAHKKLTDRLGISDRIEYLGYLNQEQLAPLLRRSLCLVFTSKLEGFGLPPLEAMANRCPAVAADCSALPEVFGDAGLLVTVGDHEAFAQAVLRISDDPELRQQLVERGVERAKQFSWFESARRMADLLENAARFARR